VSLNADTNIILEYYRDTFNPIIVSGDILVDGSLTVLFQELPTNTQTTIFTNFVKRMVIFYWSALYIVVDLPSQLILIGHLRQCLVGREQDEWLPPDLLQ